MAVHADDAEDVAVVRNDRVGVVGMALRCLVAAGVRQARRAQAIGTGRLVDAGAAEDQIGSVRPLAAAAGNLVRRHARPAEAVEVGVATDDVVLALVAEDDVEARLAGPEGAAGGAVAAALDVVMAVGRKAVDRRVDEQEIRRVAAGADALEV